MMPTDTDGRSAPSEVSVRPTAIEVRPIWISGLGVGLGTGNFVPSGRSVILSSVSMRVWSVATTWATLRSFRPGTVTRICAGLLAKLKARFSK